MKNQGWSAADLAETTGRDLKAEGQYSSRLFETGKDSPMLRITDYVAKDRLVGVNYDLYYDSREACEEAYRELRDHYVKVFDAPVDNSGEVQVSLIGDPETGSTFSLGTGAFNNLEIQIMGDSAKLPLAPVLDEPSGKWVLRVYFYPRR